MGALKNQEIEVLDKNGLLKYNPEFHPQQGKPFTLDDNIYLCKYHDKDERSSLSLALGRTVATIYHQLKRLKEWGRYETFREMSDEEWESILRTSPSEPSRRK